MDFEIKADRGISVVCAVFNGEASLVELYNRLVSALPLLSAEYEIVFVNDQSSDKSGDIIASLAAGDTAEKIISDFPSLKPEDIQAAIAFAAASAEEDLPVPAVPQIR